MKFNVLFLWTAFFLTSTAYSEDVSVIISESTVNKFISAVGPVNGKGKSKGIGYKWIVKKAEFDFEEGAAQFIANVDLNAGVFKSSDKVMCKLNVNYDPSTNKIRMNVEKAIFKIYIKVLGKKIKVGEVDIAQYYKPKFEFNGPEPVQKFIDIEVSNKKTKRIEVRTTKSELKIEKDQIRVSVELSYSGNDK